MLFGRYGQRYLGSLRVIDHYHKYGIIGRHIEGYQRASVGYLITYVLAHTCIGMPQLRFLTRNIKRSGKLAVAISLIGNPVDVTII